MKSPENSKIRWVTFYSPVPSSLGKAWDTTRYLSIRAALGSGVVVVMIFVVIVLVSILRCKNGPLNTPEPDKLGQLLDSQYITLPCPVPRCRRCRARLKLWPANHGPPFSCSRWGKDEVRPDRGWQSVFCFSSHCPVVGRIRSSGHNRSAGLALTCLIYS